MANYKETAVTGSKWLRSWQVVIENKFNKIPSVTFFEEQIVDVGDGAPTSTMMPGQLTEKFTDPSKTFNLVHPVTGATIGTASYQDLYVMLSSLYLGLAQARDYVPPPVVEVPPVDPVPQDPPA